MAVVDRLQLFDTDPRERPWSEPTCKPCCSVVPTQDASLRDADLRGAFLVYGHSAT
jgi:hypothetical protein